MEVETLPQYGERRICSKCRKVAPVLEYDRRTRQCDCGGSFVVFYVLKKGES